ncbi:MAG: hypothetical protein PWR31_88 [Bacillota bacterium]|nr:hypothetical protein [Bacillota bacterium]
MQGSDNVHSMTGFGRGSARAGDTTFTVEIRTLNHRFVEWMLHLPHELGEWEERLRQRLGRALARGRVEVWVTVSGRAWPKTVRVDKQLAAAYWQAAQALAAELNTETGVTPGFLLTLPEVVQVEEEKVDLEAWWPACAAALEEALAQVLAMRAREGKALAADLRERALNLRQLHTALEREAAQVPRLYRDRLKERLATLEVAGGIDELRLAQEVALLADRADVTEELVRLASHLDQLVQALAGEGPVGRRLEFLLQEANREVNTIGAKAQGLSLGQLVVECKAELEKMREQVQNIE